MPARSQQADDLDRDRLELVEVRPVVTIVRSVAGHRILGVSRRGHVGWRRQAEIDRTGDDRRERPRVARYDLRAGTGPLPDQLRAFGQELDRDRVSAHPGGDDRRRAVAGERIEDDVTLARVLAEDGFDE